MASEHGFPVCDVRCLPSLLYCLNQLIGITNISTHWLWPSSFPIVLPYLGALQANPRSLHNGHLNQINLWRATIICIIFGIMEQNSQNAEQRKVAQQQLVRKNNRQQPFYRNPTISFVKIGHCHMCKSRSKIGYQCYRNYQATSCEKKFCLDCLILIYKENIVEHLQKNQSWRCPYHRKICRCKNCCTSRKQLLSVLELDTNLSVFANLRQRIRPLNEEDEDDQEIDQNTKCLLKQKFKKVLELNGQLINKVNTHYHKLTEDQIKFYNRLIHSNLKVMKHLTQNQVAHQAITEE